MRTRVLGSVGALLTLAAAAVFVRPDLANSLSGVVAVIESQEPERILLGLGFVVGIYAAWAARSGSSQQSPKEGPAAQFAGVGDPPETVSAADRTRTGASFDAQIEAACAGNEEALDAVRSTLAETAVSAYVRAADRPADRATDRGPEQARRAVETGAWTDDPIAAAFLAGDAGPGFSVLDRLRAWLDPEAERRRRVERTVEAVSGVLDGRGEFGQARSGLPDDEGGENR